MYTLHYNNTCSTAGTATAKQLPRSERGVEEPDPVTPTSTAAHRAFRYVHMLVLAIVMQLQLYSNTVRSSVNSRHKHKQ
jgi:hypothetical protein